MGVVADKRADFPLAALRLAGQDAQIDVRDWEIDRLVDELYGLTAEGIGVVAGE